MQLTESKISTYFPRMPTLGLFVSQGLAVLCSGLVVGPRVHVPAAALPRLSPSDTSPLLLLRSSGARRVNAPRCELPDPQAESRAEALDYLRTLGLISGGSAALFFGLTAVGLEDVIAGNLVLVSLCAIGAYLLFFDGGVTQAALEKQAVQQLANEEGDLMASAPGADVGVFAAADLAAHIDAKAEASATAADAAARLASDGCARINGALSADAASAVLAHVNAELEARRAGADSLAGETAHFGDVLSREQRFDLKLNLEPPVRTAMTHVLLAVKPVLAAALGPDAELFELAALVSDPRAPRQPVHPDTPFREDSPRAAAVTAFVALQDVTADMGPTQLLPHTHTKEAHARFNSPDDGGRERMQLIRERPNHVGVLGAGDVNLIDSRLLHCGGANTSRKRRVLLYFSFRARGARTPSGTLLYELKRAGHRLDATDEWLGATSAAA